MGFDREDFENFFKNIFRGFGAKDAAGWVNFGNVVKGLAIFATIGLVMGAGIYMWSEEMAKEEAIKNCTHQSYVEKETYIDYDAKQLIYRCDFCKKKLTFDAHVDSHTVVEPSCSREGKISERWTFDIAGFDQTVSVPIPKLPHTLDEIVFEKEEPDCKNYGREILYRCTVCFEYVGGELIEPLGHDLVVSGFVDSTCTKTGLTNSSKCSRCNYVEYEQEVIPLKEHVYEDIHHEATYNNSGYIGQGCKNCGRPSEYVEITAPPLVDEVLTYEKDMYGDYTITGIKGTHEEIVIPDYINGIAVNSIEANAFAYNTTLKKVVIEGKLGEIKASAFKGCSNLEEINLTKVGTIGTRAFEGTGFKKLSINSSMIESYAFKDCKNLRFLEFNDDTHYIKDYAFQGCSNLWSVKMSRKAEPNHILGSHIFDGCTSLLEIIKPNWAGFQGMFPNVKFERNNKDSNLSTLIYYEDSSYFIDGGNGVIYLLLCESKDDNLTLPEKTKEGKPIILTEGCLEGIKATKLTIKQITSDVQFVSLFGTSEIKVEELTIDTLDHLNYYYINGRNAAGLPSLKKIIFTPRTINFNTSPCINYCTSLEEIELPSNGTTLLQNIYSLDWSYTFKKVTINSGEVIPQYFFEKFTNLEQITFKEGVKEIKAYSLFGKEGLNVILPKTITNIRPFSIYNVNFYYEGNLEEWESVAKGYSSKATVYYYSKENPNEEGNYWYYDSNGEIAKWNN